MEISGRSLMCLLGAMRIIYIINFLVLHLIFSSLALEIVCREKQIGLHQSQKTNRVTMKFYCCGAVLNSDAALEHFK